MSTLQLKNDYKKYPEKQLDIKRNLILSEKCQNQIEYLCEQFHSREWSGVLFCTSKEDDFVAEEIFLMNIGSSAYTEFNWNDTALIRFYKENPERLRMMKMQIHSHHNMDSFFSGTDMQELHDNAENHNLYISLIVNNRGKYVAKGCYVAMIKSKIVVDESIEYRNLFGKWISNPNKSEKDIEEKVLCVFDFTVVKHRSVNENPDLDKRINELMGKENKLQIPEKIEKRSIYQGNLFDDIKDDRLFLKQPSAKKNPENVSFSLIKESKEIDSFAAKIVSFDVNTDRSFETVCEELDILFADNPDMLETLEDDVVEIAIHSYTECFKNDIERDFEFDALELVIEKLENLQVVYPFLQYYIPELEWYKESLVDEEEIEIGDKISYRVKEGVKSGIVEKVTKNFVYSKENNNYVRAIEFTDVIKIIKSKIKI